MSVVPPRGLMVEISQSGVVRGSRKSAPPTSTRCPNLLLSLLSDFQTFLKVFAQTSLAMPSLCHFLFTRIRYVQLSHFFIQVRYGLVARICRSHLQSQFTVQCRQGPGSIPGVGKRSFCLFLDKKVPFFLLFNSVGWSAHFWSAKHQ